MCGRYSLSRPVDDLADYFQAHLAPGLAGAYEPSYNIAPTRSVVGLATTAHRQRVLGLYRWGFGGRQFNTRCEGAPDTTHRMAVVADGFFEWHEGQPLFFQRRDGAPLALAGLWAAGSERMCTMLTTAAGPDVEGIHDRMPVILELEALAEWLDPAHLDRSRVKRILRAAPGGVLVRHPVDPRVGDVRNDGPELLERFEPPEPPLRLFG